jgi:hypothetical protein
MTRGTPSRRAGAGALLALVVAAPLGATAQAEPSAPVAVSADPPRLTLRRGARSRLEIDTGGPAPLVTTSVGRVEGLHPIAPGRWAADLVPPGQGFPQVAIVSAVVGERAGFTAVPLHGRGEALVRTRRGAEITVRIGERSFGPARADDAGLARVPVEVPPGVRSARHGHQDIDLHLPPVSLVHVAVDHAEATADRAQEVRVHAFAVEADGRPRGGAPVALEVTDGEVSAAREVAPGAFEARWTVPPGAIRDAAVVARISDQPESVASARLALRAGEPVALAVESDRRHLTAGGGDAAVEVRLRDAAGNPAEGAPTGDASFGALSRFEPAGPGVFRARLSVPPALRGHRRTEVAVRAGALGGSAVIDLSPAAPAALSVEPERLELLGDGESRTGVRVALVDPFGNAVEADPPELAAWRGQLEPVEARGPGEWVARYRVPRLGDAEEVERLSARAGPLRTTAVLRLVPPQSPLALAPRVGAALGRGGLRSPYVAAEAAWRPPALLGRGGAALEVGWFAFDRSDAVAVGGERLDLRGTADFYPLLVSAFVRQPLGRRAALWGSAGVGAALVRSAVRLGTQAPVKEAGAAPAAHASLGCEVRLQEGSPFVEARLGWVGDPGLLALRGASLPVTFSVGFRHDVR